MRAFNRSLIDQFITKQAPDISRRLVDTVQKLLDRAQSRHAEIWRTTLSSKQNQLLRQSQISRELNEFSAKRWVEHVVIGEPFGVLGMDLNGQVSWLQLEPVDELEALADLATSQGQAADLVADIRRGQKLINLELHQVQSAGASLRAQPAFAIGAPGTLVGALFPMEAPEPSPRHNSYAQWLAQHNQRDIND